MKKCYNIHDGDVMNQFSRIELLLGEKFSMLKDKTILIIGLGGVGGTALECLVRSGIERFILVDFDDIDTSNLNRQIVSCMKNIGNKKVDEWEKRIASINQKAQIIKIKEFIDDSNIDKLFERNIDYVIDACDTINTKKLIIKKCLDKNIKFISCMGTGKKFHPEFLNICDLRKTSYDPIAKKLRKMLKDENVKGKIPVVYSKEEPKKIRGSVVASSIFVPSTAGILCANYIFNLIVGEE